MMWTARLAQGGLDVQIETLEAVAGRADGRSPGYSNGRGRTRRRRAHGFKANPPAVLRIADESGASRIGFAPVVKKVLPAVVNIASTKVSKIPAGMFGEGNDESFSSKGWGRA